MLMPIALLCCIIFAERVTSVATAAAEPANMRRIGAQWTHFYNRDEYGDSWWNRGDQYNDDQSQEIYKGNLRQEDDINTSVLATSDERQPPAAATGDACESGTYQPSATNCSVFQACTQGTFTEVTCPSDMWFDPRHKDNVLCNYPEVVCAADNSVCDCAAKYPPLPPDLLIEPEVKCLADNRFHFAASRVECSRYFVCFNEHVHRLECRAGFQYNPRTEACDYPEIVNCQLIDPDCPPKGVHFLAHAERTDAFYMCVQGYKTLQTCAFYHVWHAASDSCKRQDDAEVKMHYDNAIGYY